MAKRTKRLLENEEDIVDSVRLNKFLSDAGICSRREADRYIADGKVLVDGEVAQAGTKVTKENSVTFKGKEIKREEKLVLIALNKPRGIVCTTDRREKDNIVDFVGYGSRIYPIGRLDKDSEGLILLTNDGNIVNKILRAGNNHDKEYIVTINGTITSEFLKGMAAGVPILDTVTNPCKIKALDKQTFQITITQGLNRQIRRMCEYFGYKVVTLKRVRIMNIHLGHLQLGGYRNVTEKEIESLNLSLYDSSNDIGNMGGYDEDEEEEYNVPKNTTKKKKSDYKAAEFRKNNSDNSATDKSTSGQSSNKGDKKFKKEKEKRGTGQNAKGTRNPNSKINKRVEEKKRLSKEAREKAVDTTEGYKQGKRISSAERLEASAKRREAAVIRAEKNRMIIPDKDTIKEVKRTGGFGLKKSRQDRTNQYGKDASKGNGSTGRGIAVTKGASRTTSSRTSSSRTSSSRSSSSRAGETVRADGAKTPWKQPNQNRNFDKFIKGGKKR